MLAWVYKRDGRLVPFEADKISQALFAATERLGRPDAFLARELTDGVLHFLTSDLDRPIPTTRQLADTVVKVVRELGQPALAKAFLQGEKNRGDRAKAGRPAGAKAPAAAESPLAALLRTVPPARLIQAVGAVGLREYSLSDVFSRDLAAAHAEGLIALTGLETPLELAGGTLGPPRPGGRVIEALEEVRGFIGRFVAVDAPEYELRSGIPADDWVRELRIGLRATGLEAVVHLNCSVPPTWAADPGEGPLFATFPRPAELPSPAGLADDLREQLLAGPPAVTVAWHLGARDFLPEAEGRLRGLARRAAEGADLEFVFDRPRRPVLLSEGLDRHNPAALLTVGLNLPRLAGQLGPRAGPAVFVQKLASLARLALSAGTQKRAFLRRHSAGRPALTEGFRLERARLVVVPLGLEAVVRHLLHQAICAAGPALELAKQIVQQLRDTLHRDGRASLLETCLDAPAAITAAAEPVAGLTCWDETSPAQQQIKVSGALQAVTERGTAVVVGPPERSWAAEEVLHLIRYAWQKTDVARLRFLRLAPESKQMTAPWASEMGAESQK